MNTDTKTLLYWFVLALSITLLVLCLFDPGKEAQAFEFPPALQQAAGQGQMVDQAKCGRQVGTWHEKGTDSAPLEACLRIVEDEKWEAFAHFNRLLAYARSQRNTMIVKRALTCFNRDYSFGGVLQLKACLSGIEHSVLAMGSL